MCYHFRDGADVYSLVSNIAALFHLNSSDMEEEIFTLQANIQLKSRAHGQFWNILTHVRYMRKYVNSLTALFSSTYLYEPAFSHMKIIKSMYCSTMTAHHLEVSLSSSPDSASLADSFQCIIRVNSGHDKNGHGQLCYVVQYWFMQLCKVHQLALY